LSGSQGLINIKAIRGKLGTTASNVVFWIVPAALAAGVVLLGLITVSGNALKGALAATDIPGAQQRLSIGIHN
jgi:hypothetical protein